MIGSVALATGVVTLAGLAVSSYPIDRLDRLDEVVVSPKTPRIRVLLARDETAVKVEIDGAFNVLDGRGQTVGSFDQPLPPSRIRGGVAPHRGPFVEVGNAIVGGPVVELAPARSGALRVRWTEGRLRRYRGSLRLVLRDDGGVDVINVVDIESYLKGVLRGELPGSFHREAFRAQAIAARTYALYHRETAGRRRTWDVVATQGSQVYLGTDGERRGSKASEAVDSTRGEVLTWDHDGRQELVCTFYCAVCGGRTRDVRHVSFLNGIPPLSGNVVCPYCRQAPKDQYRWGPVTISKARIAEALKSRYDRFRAIGDVSGVEVAEADDHGRPIVLRITDDAGRSARIRSENFRLAIDSTGMKIKSDDFELVDRPGEIELKNGRGWGHGAGLCQWGSEGMARAGKRAEEILATYYPHSQLRKIDG